MLVSLKANITVYQLIIKVAHHAQHHGENRDTSVNSKILSQLVCSISETDLLYQIQR